MPKWDFAAGNVRMLPDLMKRHPKGSQQSEAFALLSYEFPDNNNCFYTRANSIIDIVLAECMSTQTAGDGCDNCLQYLSLVQAPGDSSEGSQRA